MTTSQNTDNPTDLEVQPAIASEDVSDDAGLGINVGEAIEQQWQPNVPEADRPYGQAAWPETMDSDEERLLPCNVGRAEQGVRIGVGAAMLAAAAFAPLSRGWRIALGAAGAAEVITGAIRYCPINQALGRDSSRNDAW